MASRPIPMVLNRQLIKILEDLNVPDAWFFRLQERELNSLRFVLKTGSSIAKFLRSQNIGVSFGLSGFYQLIHECQLEFREDNFLRSVIETVVPERLRLLKFKARIPVDEVVTLFGVMDETRFLKEHEVYVTFDHPNGLMSGHMLNRAMLVTRSPALHTGDVQLVTHVNPPLDSPLSSLSNCIVFSRHGVRNVPSMLSGGDLDGDLYNVLWAREVIKQTHEPADYARAQEVILDRPVQRSDMVDFFIEFMKSDILGVISNRHMMIADQKQAGTLPPDCVKLAELCSRAVDYSKSGKPVSLTDLPCSSRFRPDFLSVVPPVRILERSQVDFDAQEEPVSYDSDDEHIESAPPHKYYESEKLLGRLYGAIDEKKTWKDDIHKVIPKGAHGIWSQILTLMTARCQQFGISWQRKADEAHRIKDSYEDVVKDMMFKYSEHPTHPLTELEVFIGSVHNKLGAQTRRQRENSIKLKDSIDRATSFIAKSIRKVASGYYDGSELASVADDAASTVSMSTEACETTNERYASVELALACLHVACLSITDDSSTKKNARIEQLVSFRIVAASVLRTEMEWAVSGWTKPQMTSSPSLVMNATERGGDKGRTRIV